jgi:hypothetical protein
MRRREFLTLSAASIGGVLVYSLDGEVFRLSSQADKSIRIPLRFFSKAEALIVAAAACRIFPSDEAGPGAREAGVPVRRLPQVVAASIKRNGVVLRLRWQVVSRWKNWIATRRALHRDGISGSSSWLSFPSFSFWPLMHVRKQRLLAD